jgi:hypothetical protein
MTRENQLFIVMGSGSAFLIYQIPTAIAGSDPDTDSECLNPESLYQGQCP